MKPTNNTAGPMYECPKCKKKLQSKFRHDFVMCDCENKAFVDGGNDYIRLGAVNDFPKLAK